MKFHTMNYRANLWLKFFAGILALILWVYVWGERKANKEIPEEIGQREFDQVPLAILEDPLPSLMADPDRTKVSLVIEGEKDIIERIAKEELVGYLDLRGLSKGVYQLPPSWKLPAGVKIVAASPEFIAVTLEDKKISEKMSPLAPAVIPGIKSEAAK